MNRALARGGGPDSGITMARDVASMLDEIAGDVARLAAPADGVRPVLLPAYGAARGGPNLTALVALMLKRFGVAVLVHGRPDGPAPGRAGVTAAEVLRELGASPAATLADAQAQLARESLAFVPVDLVAPRLARRLRANGEDGPVADEAFPVAQLLDPFGGAGFRVVCAAGPDAARAMRDFLAATRADALLVENAAGDPYPDATHPRLEAFVAGIGSAILDDTGGDATAVPPAADLAATVAWTRAALEGSVPVPDAVVAEIGACLDGARRPAVRR